MIVKPEHLQDAENLFSNTGIKITVQGHKHLGSPLGTRAFVEEFVRSKVDGWVTEIEKLSESATFQPQVAYAAFTHGLKSSRCENVAKLYQFSKFPLIYPHL